MRHPLWLALLLPLLLLAAGTVRAEDAAPAPDPAAAFSKALDRLPAPAEGHAFDFEGSVLIGGNPMGTVWLKAAPSTLPDGKPGWHVTEKVEMMGGEMMRTAEAWLDRRLQPVKGTLSQKAPGGASATTKVPHQGDTLATMTSMWLFCANAFPAEATYAMRAFEPAPEGDGTYFEQARLTLDGKGDWQGRPAFLVHGEKEEVTVEAGFDAETRALLGADFRQPNGMQLSFRPKTGDEAPATPGDPFAAPAASPEDAALTAAMAFATGDVELVDAIVHWPTVHGAMKADHEAATAGQEDAEPFPGLEELKAAILDELRASLPKNPRPMIEAGLKMVKPQLKKETLEGGITRVQFPEMFRSMVLDVGERDGKWYLVRFPR